MDKLAALVKADTIDYKFLGYEYVAKEGTGFSICHSEALDELINTFAGQFISHENLEEDKFGALYQVMRMLAEIICDCKIDEIEKKTNG